MEDEAWIRRSGEKRSGAVSPAVFGSGLSCTLFGHCLGINLVHTRTYIYISKKNIYIYIYGPIYLYIRIYIYIIAASIDIAQREVDVYTYGIPRLH